MVVAVLPFLGLDRDIRDKEVLNGFYHPLMHHFAMTVASIPAVLILALVITVILVGMVKLQNATSFFLILMLALWCAESYAFLIALCIKNYIIGIVCLAGVSMNKECVCLFGINLFVSNAIIVMFSYS